MILCIIYIIFYRQMLQHVFEFYLIVFQSFMFSIYGSYLYEKETQNDQDFHSNIMIEVEIFRISNKIIYIIVKF